MKVNLVNKGIFPILYDKDGNLIEGEKLDTGYAQNGTCQGEGRLVGTPSFFLRTSACNIRCVWYNADNQGSPCDTVYSSHLPEKNNMEVEDIIQTLYHNKKHSNINHLVITGGEPMMQVKPMLELTNRIKSELGFHITVETNATIFDAEIAKNVDLVSMSPKLSNSVPTKEKFSGKEMEGLTYSEHWEEKHKKLRLNLPVMQQWIDAAHLNNNSFQLKFVVSTPKDLEEIKEIQNSLKGIVPSDIFLMPEGYYAEDIMSKTPWIVEKCIENGYTFTTRLHTLLWGTKRGV